MFIYFYQAHFKATKYFSVACDDDLAPLVGRILYLFGSKMTLKGIKQEVENIQLNKGLVRRIKKKHNYNNRQIYIYMLYR